MDEKKQKRLLAKVDQIFEQLDDWRHLPTYQLERRADIFFSLYLPKVLKDKTGKDINDIIIPEFPLHKKTLSDEEGKDNKKANNQSYRADYFALSKDRKRAFLVELKTDGGSSRDAQDDYLGKAKNARLPALLEGVKTITGKTKSKRKYFCLLKKLNVLGLVNNLDPLETIMTNDTLHGFSNALENIDLPWFDPEIELICIQPTKRKRAKIAPYDYRIFFEDVRKVVIRHKDPLSKRFAESLEAWEARAGDCFR